MKSLQERFSDYKFIKKKVEESNCGDGYSLKYNCDEGFSSIFTINFLFDKKGNYSFIRKNKEIIEKLPKSFDNKKLKEICFSKAFQYLRKNVYVKFGEIWNNSMCIFENKKGDLIHLSGMSEEAIDRVRNASLGKL